MDIPLTEFAGFLKQIDAASLSADARESLAVALPHFWPKDPPADESTIKARARQIFGSFKEDRMKVTIQRGPNRRFSGGEGLPRQRYHTLSRDLRGDDNLTLLAEMRAYRSCRDGQICTVLDSYYPPGQRLLQAQGIPARGGNVLALVFLEERRPMANSAPAFDLQVLTLPYTVTETTIPRVLDLRLLAAQRWLVQTFCVEKRAFHYPILGRDDVTFPDLLPFLVTIELGGGGFTESIGKILRQNQVNALIYPSARNDAWAYQKNQQLMDWFGWCLVDYRGAETDVAELVDLGEQTPFTFPAPTHIKKWDDGIHQGSWATVGLRELYRYRFFVELSHKFGEPRSKPIIDSLLQLEGGAEEFWQFASEYTDPLP